MAIRSKQFYVPLGDTALRGVNRFLATLEREQIRNVAATPKGRGTNIHVTYEDAVPPRLLSSSPSHNAWVRQGSFPSTMTLVFQKEVDPASIQDGTFRWVLLGSVEPVTASSVTVGEEGRLVTVPLPTAALSGYEGLLTLVGQDFASVDGAITRDRLQVGIQVTNGYIPREGDIPAAQSVPQGRMVLHRFYGHRVQLEHLLDNFVRGRRMDGQEMIQTVLLSHADQEEEAFVLWYEASHPRIASIQPQPGSNVPSEYGLEQITIAFSEPVSEYHLKGLDGYDRVLWNGSAFGGTFTQEDDVGAIWTLSDTGLLSTEGVHTLRLRDLRNTDGEPNGILAQYYWSVTPASENFIQKTGWDLDARDTVTKTFDDPTRTLSLAPVSSSFSFWVQGKKFTKTTTQSVAIDDVEGLWFIYFDQNGDLTASQTPWNLADDNSAFVAVLYWDATNNVHVILGEEMHTWVMDPAVHAYLHNTQGTQYKSGLALSNMDTDGSGNDASAAQIGMGNGEIYDEDLLHEIVDGDPQTLAPVAQIPVLYRTGPLGYWRKVPATDYPITTTGTGRAAWNEWTGATWQVSEVDHADFVLVHLFATNDIEEHIVAVMGQAMYTTISDARDGADVEMTNLRFGEIAGLVTEFLPIATLIFETNNTYGNAVKSRIRTTDTGDDYIDWRTSTSSASATTGVTDHGALTGLADDDHAQYALADGTRGDFETSGAVTGHESTYDHTKIHDQNTDQYLDFGGISQVSAAQAKAGYDHSQVTTGNPHSLDAGDVGADPAGTASGLVGTHESTYDHGKLHDQGTDQGLDTGGPNAVTAAQAKAGYDHSQVTTGNPHSLDAADVGADPAGTATTAVSNHEAAGDPHPGYALESALGTAAAADLGVGVGDVPALENVGGTPGLPAVDGSQLTGLPSGVSDHGALTGLGDDDHSQYHNDTRGDARYYTQTQLDAGQLDSRYYTEAETDSAIDTDVATHAAIADAHHARYADSEAVAAIKADAAWNATDWDTAFGWGNHALGGYLTAETDPVFGSSVAAGIGAGDITNWDTAFGWGDHAGLYDAAGTASSAVSSHEGLTDPHTGYLLAAGTRALAGNWDAGSFQIRAETFQSDVVTGTAPFTVASATLVNNLNADLLDGLQASVFVRNDQLTNIAANTEWQDGYEVRIGSDADVGTQWNNGLATLLTRIYTNSGLWQVSADDAGGTERVAAVFSAAAQELYAAGTKRFETTGTGATVTGDLAVTGTVDGRDVASDGGKLDGIDAGATAGATWGSNIASQPSVVSQAEAEAGAATTERIWTAERVAQAIAAQAEAAGAVGTHESAGDPHPGYQLESEKGAADGYAPLDAGGLVLFSDLPVGTGATQVAQGDHNHSGTYEPADATILKEADVDDTPVDAATTVPISSNWAYDHVAAADPHTGYQLESGKNAASGYAGLDGSSLLDPAQLPAMSTSDKGAVPATGAPSGKYLKDDGTWDTPSGGTDYTVGLYDADLRDAYDDGSGSTTYTNSYTESGEGTLPYLGFSLAPFSPSDTQYVAFRFQIPPGFNSSTHTLRIRVRAKAETAASVTKDLDVICHEAVDAGGTPGSDLCTTAAQTITASWADYNFTITDTGLAVGDIITVRVAMIIQTGPETADHRIDRVMMAIS